MCSISFGTFVFALVLANVTSWTIDLPDARKFIFEKNDLIEKRRHEENRKVDIAGQVLLSNRYDSNSKHHDKPRRDDDGSYAKRYGYHSYAEKTVRDIVHDGSEYLEGLQNSIEDFTVRLENCSRINKQDTFRFNFTSFNLTSFNASSVNLTSANTSEAWRPTNELPPYNETSSNSTEQCRRVTKASEHVRRLAELAVKATKDLQDIAYSKQHLKDDPHTLAKAENELILKLAWFLDRLAYYTDYQPQYKKYIKEENYLSVTRPLNVTEALKMRMMNCLKEKSEIPATVRCAFPQNQTQAPGIVDFVVNNTTPNQGSPASSNRIESVYIPATSDQELLITSDNRPKYFPYHLTPVTHVRKRSVPEKPQIKEPENLAAVKMSKRAAENPAITFMKYFVKHKIWENSNPNEDMKPVLGVLEEFEVSNHLPRVKRATDEKKLHLPEDPFQDLSKYVKNKKGVNYVKDEMQADKIRAFVGKLINSKTSTPKQISRRVSKFRSKRSYTYERDVDKPRNPDNLFKDISYYVKNKPGTNFNRDFVQAAQVRAGLELIFLNPDIQTVRMYGANFNPLIPDPLLSGAARSAADN